MEPVPVVVIFAELVTKIPRFCKPELLPPVPFKLTAPDPEALIEAPLSTNNPCFCPLLLSPPRPDI